MKRTAMKRLSALLLALCLLLSACAEAPGPAPSDPAPSDPAPSASVPPAPVPSEPSRCDAHGDEYATKLADLEELAQGKQVLACEVGPADWDDSTWDGKYIEGEGYDARSCDVSGEDLSGIEDWNDISFNSDTVWPAADKLPEGFDPEAVLELGKDPGLGIRALHDQGITGEGVGVAIIGSGLYTGHEQYGDNLMLYEYIHCEHDYAETAWSGGPAASSIAVGRDVGVAPGAKLYFIACDYSHNIDGRYEIDLSVMADSVYRVLEINGSLPEGEKIRVISIPIGIDPDMPGYEDMAEAVQAADGEGILVLNVGAHFYEFDFYGMCREGLSDPNDPKSYQPMAWLTGAGKPSPELANAVLIPMGGRTYAACTGEADYQWDYVGGMSQTVPWLAGFYALCCQADPNCTPGRFFQAVQDTASVKLTRVIRDVYSSSKPNQEGLEREYSYGRIIDPAAAIEALKTQ